jgi:hypothetical protein
MLACSLCTAVVALTQLPPGDAGLVLKAVTSLVVRRQRVSPEPVMEGLSRHLCIPHWPAADGGSGGGGVAAPEATVATPTAGGGGGVPEADYPSSVDGDDEEGRVDPGDDIRVPHATPVFLQVGGHKSGKRGVQCACVS